MFFKMLLENNRALWYSFLMRFKMICCLQRSFDMVINFLGDSITCGVGASSKETCYVSLVGKKLGCVVNNFGVSGSRIARQSRVSDMAMWDEDFNIRIWRMGEADLVFVFGGTNDYGHGDAELGSFGDTGIFTFCGAFDTLLRQLIKKYGKEKLCYILPLPRYNQSGITDHSLILKKDPRPLSEYIEAERRILTEYGIDYIDMTEDFPEPDTKEPSEFFVDGLHPNDKGYEKIADRVCEYISSRK